MRTYWLIAAAIVLIAYLWFRSTRQNGAIVRALRIARVMNGALTAYREGDYQSALEKAEGLKDDLSKTAEYCFFHGSMLHHLGRFDEAEASLREGLPLEEDPRKKALVFNTLASVLMAQQRFPEAIAFYESAGRAWPERGSNHRGIAEVWLRQGRELTQALEHAQLAVKIDRQAGGMQKDTLDTRLGEDLGVLAWAVAATSGDASAVETILAEAFPLCGTKTKPILAELHYHAGRAYGALEMRDKSQEHFQQAAANDPHGIFGNLARCSTAPTVPRLTSD